MKSTKEKNLFNEQLIRKEHYKELVLNWKLEDKIFLAKKRIREFIEWCETKKNINEITISFSGGKDSTVLLDLVMKVHHEIKSKIPIVMVYATEITFPDTIKFIKEINLIYQQKYPNELKNLEIVYPKKTWNEILTENGYPIFSKQISTLINRVKRSKTQNYLTQWFFNINKNQTSTSRFKLSEKRLFLLDDNILFNWPDISNEQKMINYFKKYKDQYFFSEKCCDFIKGNLKHDKRPSFIGVMAEESLMRKRSWIDNGCNIYQKNKIKSRPLSIWTTKDIWSYIKQNKLYINPSYGFDCNKDLSDQDLRFNRLGCVSCPYGSSIEEKIIDKLRGIDSKESYKKNNRFEILKKDYPNLYLSQVINNGMYKILIDMGIKILNDELYMKLYHLRRNQINEWYDNKNFRSNLLNIMCQIENHNDYKNKGEKYEWSYKINEFNQALKSFNISKLTNSDEIKKIRDKVKKQYQKYYL